MMSKVVHKKVSPPEETNKVNFPKENYKKAYLITTLLVGVVLSVFLLQSMIMKRNYSSTLPVEFSFVKDAESVSSNVSYKLLADPKNNKVSFIRVSLYFDPSLLQLSQDLALNTSIFGRIIFLTPMVEANTSGTIEIVLALEPGAKTPDDELEVAQLTFSNVGGTDAEVSIVDEDTQVVDSSSKQLPFTSNTALIATY